MTGSEKTSNLEFLSKMSYLLPAYRVTQELQLVIFFVPKATHPQVISVSVGFVLSIEMAKAEENIKQSSTSGLGRVTLI